MRILFVAPYIPSAIRVRPFQLIRTLAAQGHFIHLVALQPPEDTWARVDPLRGVCARVDVFPMTRARTLWNGLAALPGSLPLQAAYSHHPRLEHHLREVSGSGAFDVLHVEHLRGAVLARRLTTLPRVFDSVDSITLLFKQAARRAPKLSQRLIAITDLRRTQRFESQAPLEFERTIITSALDREELVRLAGPAAEGSVVVIPNGVDTTYFRPADMPPIGQTVVFSGKMSYHANAAAALSLAREVMPAVWRCCPEARLVIAGKGPSQDVLGLTSDPRIVVTGYVEDIRTWLAQATVAAAPMLYAAGIQNKVLEAMASGVPVVTTPRAAGSLQAQAGHDYLVGNSTDAIAREIVRVLQDGTLRARLAANGRRYVERHHDWREIAKRLVAVYEEAGDVWAARNPLRPRSEI
jgi:glycosyltransferase involved in cell wall biosynthesis